MKTVDELTQRFVDEFESIDEVVVCALKGHLLIEELLDQIIQSFVFHPEFWPRLTFQQKMQIARTMSLDESKNTMWHLIADLNALRNCLAHELKSPDRKRKSDRLRNHFLSEMTEHPDLEKYRHFDDREIVVYSAALSLGFLHEFGEEISRFKTVVSTLDRALNAHPNNV